jgi:hypothetical protein
MAFQWHTDHVSATLDGKEHTYKFLWREPVDFFDSLVTDPSLMTFSHFHAVRKWMINHGRRTRLFDEPWTGDDWWKIEVHINQSIFGTYTHGTSQDLLTPILGLLRCYAPFLIWLDKGMVSTRVKMYPIVLRPLWIQDSVRNASGNGGGVIIGFMPIVSSPEPCTL